MSLIAPSILAADFGRLAGQVREVTEAGADWIHVDVMDGHFVPNLSMGPDICGAVDKATDIPLDVHLMITDPDRYVETFAKNGADIITVHTEVLDDPEPVFRQIEAAGARPGLALNPPTDVERVLPFVERCALILVMSVNPGYGGQSFMDCSLPKLEALRNEVEKTGADCHLEVDGGVNLKTAPLVREAGADVLVAGSAVFGADDYRQRILDLRG